MIWEDVQTVPPDITFMDLISTIQAGSQSIYPVAEHGKLLGIIRDRDLNEIIRACQTLSASIEE